MAFWGNKEIALEIMKMNLLKENHTDFELDLSMIIVIINTFCCPDLKTLVLFLWRDGDYIHNYEIVATLSKVTGIFALDLMKELQVELTCNTLSGFDRDGKFLSICINYLITID